MPCSAHKLNVSVNLRDLPSLGELLISGGDARIALEPDSGLNKYGCQPYPDPQLLAFGSSTASVISPAGFAAADLLRERLQHAAGTAEVIYEREMQRIRQELLGDISDSDTRLVFATSGTDAHFIAVQHVAGCTPIRVVMVEEDETGSGVAVALTGNSTAGVAARGGGEIELRIVPLRLADGMPRLLTEIDADVSELVGEAVKSGQHVLLIMVDQSKTGLIAPGTACVSALHRLYPDKLNVLVDACQFRIAPPTLRTYLQQGFMVALTGSKFLTGPSFSAALLLPVKFAQRAEALAGVNFGLLLRWEAALAELRRFRAVPQAEIVDSLQAFAGAVQARLKNDSHFELLPVPPLDRRPLTEAVSWDHLPTIFPFLLYHPDGRIPFSRQETLQIYSQLQVSQSADKPVALLRCQFGQPVACGTRDGIAVSALRLCISARLISDAADQKGISGVIKEALSALDKAAWLVDRLKD